MKILKNGYLGFIILVVWASTINAATYTAIADVFASSPYYEDGSSANGTESTVVATARIASYNVVGNFEGRADTWFATNELHGRSFGLVDNYPTDGLTPTTAGTHQYAASVFNFTSSTSLLHVSFDYSLDVNVSIYEGGISSAKSELSLIIRDNGTFGGPRIYSFFDEIEVLGNEPQSKTDTLSGTFDEVLSLDPNIVGHTLELGFYLSQDLNVVRNAIASATGQITSINISEVPIPLTAWLFGSGLLGLVGFAKLKVK